MTSSGYLTRVSNGKTDRIGISPRISATGGNREVINESKVAKEKNGVYQSSQTVLKAPYSKQKKLRVTRKSR